MAEQTDPIEPVAPATSVPTVAAESPRIDRPERGIRRSITLPLLPVAIVGGVVAALLFLGGGVAIGYSVASHDGRAGYMQPVRGGHHDGRFGAGPGTGFGPGQRAEQNRPNPRQIPGDRPTPTPAPSIG